MRGIGLADSKILVVKDENISSYGFGDDHPFGPDRHGAFHRYLTDSGISSLVHLAASGYICLLYTSPSPRDLSTSRMPSSA